jgi:transmembrane 9 superfamily protein 2/4
VNQNAANYKDIPELWQFLEENEEIIYTYDVIFRSSNIKWATRWDHYLHSQNSQIHWVSILNSNIIILVFTLLIAHIFCRALKRDIDYINSVYKIFNYSEV